MDSAQSPRGLMLSTGRGRSAASAGSEVTRPGTWWVARGYGRKEHSWDVKQEGGHLCCQEEPRALSQTPVPCPSCGGDCEIMGVSDGSLALPPRGETPSMKARKHHLAQQPPE